MKNTEMSAVEFINKIKAVCDNAERCSECPLENATAGICTIPEIDFERMIEVIK